MKKDKKILSDKSIVICGLIFSVVSISNVYAATNDGPTKKEKEDACFESMLECEIQCDSLGSDDPLNGNGLDNLLKNACLSSKGCSASYNSCINSIKVVGGGFVKPTLGGQDAYINPVVKGNKDLNKNTFVPNSGFVAPSPTNNGSSRTPAKPAAPMNKSLVAPLVVPTKKTNTIPTISQPQIRTMSAPTIQPKQRVESPAKRKVVMPSSSTVPKNKITVKPAVPATSKDVKKKSNQPAIRKMNSAPAINGGKSKVAPATKNNFDEADAIFSKRTNVPNTQSR